jgi:hypothetical protein
LQELHLGGNHIGSAGASSLLHAVANHEHMRILSLECNDIEYDELLMASNVAIEPGIIKE